MRVDTEKIKIAMARKQMSVNKLAERMEVTRGALSMVINNKYKENKPETVGKLAKVLGVDVTDILHGVSRQ